MSILSNQLPNSVLGLKNQTPATFGTTPAGALHDTYSTNGTPSVRWTPSNGIGRIPQPSLLDDIKASQYSPYTPGNGSYLLNRPQ